MAHQDDTRPEAENGKKNAVRVAPPMGGITKINDYHPGFQDVLLFPSWSAGNHPERSPDQVGTANYHPGLPDQSVI